MTLTLDYETRSEADLTKVGAWEYSIHPSTDVLCVGWECDDVKGQWRMGQEAPENLFALLLFDVDTFEAHNAFFEMCIWQNVCHARYGWPAIPMNIWRCSASKAAAVSIPRSLAGAGNALRLKTVKDELYGKSAMMKLSRPRKPTKNNPSIWNDDPEIWSKMLEYNQNDVASEVALSAALPALTPKELRVWQLSERMNLKGIGVDTEGCRAARQLAEEYKERLAKEFRAITGINPGQRAAFLVWLNRQGVCVTDTTAETLDKLLKFIIADKPVGPIHRAIEIVRAVGRSSVKKYDSMIEYAKTDGRARGLFLYCGATTGRWAGRGIQPHNYPRGGKHDMDQMWRVIHDRDLLEIELLYGDPLKFLSHALRGALWAAEGQHFLVADFAAIETRVLFWLAGETKGLEVLRRGEDIYCDMASDIYRRLITKANAVERQFGKQAILGLGFGMGFIKFFMTCKKYGITFTRAQIGQIVAAGELNAVMDWIYRERWGDIKKMIPDIQRSDLPALALMKYAVDRYRRKYAAVPRLWADCELGARTALQVKDCAPFKTGKVLWSATRIAGKQFLVCELPSGRKLHYPEAEIVGNDITHMVVDDKGQWVRRKTYGGMLAENVTQAVARDVMAEAMLRLDAHPTYKNSLVATVHDELIAELPKGRGSVKEFVQLIETVPDWAAGMPIAAVGWEGKRYKKE